MATNFQTNLYQFILNYIEEHSCSPSFKEITSGLGISPRSKSLVTRSLRALAKEGKIALTKQGRQLLISLPTKKLLLVGRISAGVPIEAISQHEVIDLYNMMEGKDHFALEVKGTSMVDEGILHGDIIICRRSFHAEEGDIVVALIDQHEATLKRISFKTKNLITLIPANPNLKPKTYSPEQIQIQGIYIGLVRKSF